MEYLLIVQQLPKYFINISCFNPQNNRVSR